MTAPPLPYFFDEAELAANAKQPGDREKALQLTTGDLKWLKAVYLATHAARVAHTPGMLSQQLLLTPDNGTPIPLAGAFSLSKPDDGEVILYTPWKGLIKYADMADLTSALERWLGETSGKRELLRYLSIDQRRTALAAQTLSVSTQTIDGAVFEDQETVIERNQQQNITAMLAELLRFPSLRSMLDDVFKTALGKRFPALDQRKTRMESFDGSHDPKRRLSSLSLHEAVLHFYLNNQWPDGDTRIFVHPAHGASSTADNQAWETALTQIAQSLTPHLRSLLETFWNSPMANGLSRAEFFADSLRDTFCVDLLLKRQKAVLTTEEYLRLMEVSLAGTDGLPVTSDPVKIEKVRVTAPLKHFVTLASTLLIDTGKTSAFLYTQSRGVETSGDLGQIKNTLLSMMKSEGHDDNLFNFLSLEERETYLKLESQERAIVAAPVSGPVFQNLIADIIGKQLQNLGYALSRFRDSAGVLDPYALLDSALDVRAMLDRRLLDLQTNGRWSTRADQRWKAQPATIRADSAKQQLALLNSVEYALEQQLEKHPAIAPTVTTIEQAQASVHSSLELLKPKFSHTLSTALRSELKLRTLARTLSPVQQAIIQTVLETPVRLQRAALNGFLPDVFALELQSANAKEHLKLASCFVLTERGGLDPEHSGNTILWTPALGFEGFASLQPMLAELEKRLLSELDRPALVENLQRDERLPGRALTLAPLQLIHGDFLEHLQQPHVRLDKTAVERVLAENLPATQRADLLSLTALRVPKTGLTRATEIAQSLITRQAIPTWLANASIEDQILHCELLGQYLNHARDDKDYLCAVRTLQRTAHHELQKQLVADGHAIDPDTIEIQIIAGATSAARTQTLPAFALIHLKELETLSFKALSLTRTALPAAIDQAYVKNLLRNLKLGEHQRTELNNAFADSNADAVASKKLFNAQLPWQLMHYAHAEKLQERLSQSGFELVRQVMDMPDAIARDAVPGTDALIRPLELMGATLVSAIKVPGVYLIGRKDPSQGPLVLLAPYSAEHSLREYENHSALLAELKTAGALQRWVLDSLPASDRLLCKNCLTATTGAPVGLASSPISGSLFKQLFNDNALLLARLLGCQSNNDGQIEWETIKRVLGEDLSEALTFVSGKLAYPVAVWRSYREIKTSAEQLQAHRWGPAVRSFIHGIAQLVTLRGSMESREPAPTSPGDVSAPWQPVDTTAPERTRLQRYENTEVDLSALTLDSKLALYTDPVTQQRYAPIAGKVYPLDQQAARWFIPVIDATSKTKGPLVVRNPAQQWVLDAVEQPPRYNLFGRLRTWDIVSQGMNVEADGMSAIQRLFPVRARLINEGLDLATHYAWNSFRNLQLLKNPTAAVTPVHQLIQNFLGVPAVLPEHTAAIEKVLLDIFGALLDPSLRHVKSKRFVVGRVHEDSEFVFAFAVPADPLKKIYLANKFFFPKLDHYRNYMTDVAFPISAHARASTLIHELSHIACKTEDIAYLEAYRPFSDLIETSSPRAKALRDTLEDIQLNALSKSCPLTRLFTVINPVTQSIEDLGDTSYEESDRALARVFALTGKTDLDDARAAFMADSRVRLAVQLGNADSVAWLISHLGRHLHSTTP
ncbi:hypothetical protein BI292_19610 [Pseudomonas sp. 43NM1]|uniref:dermonecrotic toxin domain-containing protein n=1 Tax=Pseudomonas sp. 43NM1 TaxID=1904755 RepID=UPI000C3251FC|nr:DUF6543 domain-containing protein [Pseudomonas sp. 43NM1]PKH15831.1 hypothetical protein BI292_19610 [Pseudomonas sp. 43NM1]